MRIIKAELSDLPAVLTLQRLAYQSEAQLVDDFSIPPLTQTLEELTADFGAGIILIAVEQSRPTEIAGSVRGRFSGNTLHIGRLIVNPSRQNRGIGTALLRGIEALYPRMRYELFTSDRSVKNLSLYIKNGYREFKREPLNKRVNLVFLEKHGS
ncbi:MAG: GNAT family N-acetyltransferase [Oscillospiraceae bacterium]|nr:GNAT family N-acetyltransferase [Oscillospiraceae bacterium]